jgi:2,3-bisphosphoglycerate-independent phosphoglycerate mutase
MKYKPVMLMILDGWGICPEQEGNAIALADKPFYDHLLSLYPHAVLETSGEAVGLPPGQMGNSEVGHMNIGAGRVVYQELTRISRAIKTGEFQNNPVLCAAFREAGDKGRALHLIGLLSDGGVHSHIEHLFALLESAKKQGLKEVYVHVILDGRDVPPANAKEYIKALEEKMAELRLGRIATVAGRYYTMDRDKRWDRVEKGYRAMVSGEGPKACLAMEAVERAYSQRITDEFVEPTVIVDDRGEPLGLIKAQDAVIFYNFRADRARQISHAFVDPVFEPFQRPGGYLNLYYVCMTQYDITLDAAVAFPPQNLDNTLGEVVSKAGLKQLRIAETEKYAHVTFFFNGGQEEAYPGEERILIPSPNVATYNLQPEMSACQISDKVVERLQDSSYDLIVLNYANADMVGHTGQLMACVFAVEAVDSCMKQVVEAVLEQGGAVLITADHGNAEEMVDQESGGPQTAHSANLVPVILAGRGTENLRLQDGSLQDIAPTILDLMGLPKPPEMGGKSLIISEQ